MKLSFSTRGWAGCSWDEWIDTAVDMRFGGVEVYNAHKADALFEKGGPFHKYNLVASVRALGEKKLTFSEAASAEIGVLFSAISEIANLAVTAFETDNVDLARRVEPLEQTVATLKSRMRANHIARMQRGQCSIEAGFVWADLLTNCERVCAHCSNLAGCVIEMSHATHALHGYLRSVRVGSEEYRETLREYEQTYSI